MKLIPEEWSIGLISQFLSGSVRLSLHKSRNTKILRSLARGENIKASGYCKCISCTTWLTFSHFCPGWGHFVMLIMKSMHLNKLQCISGHIITPSKKVATKRKTRHYSKIQFSTTQCNAMLYNALSLIKWPVTLSPLNISRKKISFIICNFRFKRKRNRQKLAVSRTYDLLFFVKHSSNHPHSRSKRVIYHLLFPKNNTCGHLLFILVLINW